MQCVAVCCSVLQFLAVPCSTLQCDAVFGDCVHCIDTRCCSVLKRAAVCCSVTVCCSDAVCCCYQVGALQRSRVGPGPLAHARSLSHTLTGTLTRTRVCAFHLSLFLLLYALARSHARAVTRACYISLSLPIYVHNICKARAVRRFDGHIWSIRISI